MDDTDRASELEEMHRVNALRAARRQGASLESANECAECGLEIPSARQLAVPGTQYCVECVQAVERLRKGYAHE